MVYRIYSSVILAMLAFAVRVNAQPTAPSNVVATAIDTDSLAVTWTDNSSTEDDFLIRVTQNDGTALLFVSAANTEADTLAPWWPPGSKFVVDVAARAGTDTVYSGLTSIVYTSPAVPPPSDVTKWLADTSAIVQINGPLLRDRFTDRNYTASPVWTVEDGTFEVHSLDRQLRTTASDTSIIRTTFADVSGDSVNDGQWDFNFKFTDSTAATSQWLKVHLMAAKSSISDSSHYAIKIMGKDSVKAFRASTSGVETLVAEMKGWIGTQLEYKIHSLKIVRDFDGTPQDTTVTWTVTLDDTTTLFTFTDSTYTDSQYLAFSTNGATDIRIDDVIFRQTAPSGNYSEIQYAVQDAVSGNYLTLAGTLGGSTETWGTWSDFGAAVGDTITNLVANTSYDFRSKARSPMLTALLVTDAGLNIITDTGANIEAVIK